VGSKFSLAQDNPWAWHLGVNLVDIGSMLVMAEHTSHLIKCNYKRTGRIFFLLFFLAFKVSVKSLRNGR
jgi:hypothetical protein